MPTVIVTGGDGVLGRRVVARLESDPAVDRVVALGSGAGVDLAVDDLKPLLEGAAAVVHLAWDLGTARQPDEGARWSVTALRRVAEAAGAVGVAQLVHVSSALVYGAWPGNPVPISEGAPIRPNPGVVPAAAHAEAERLLTEWRDAHPATRLAVLRPALTLGDGRSWLTRGLLPPDGAPFQFLAVDDLAGAVVGAVRAGLDGVYNVAPEGWVAEDTARALVGRGLRVPLPGRLRGWAALRGWELGLSAHPPVLSPYRVHPWVVASDRLRATGWEPLHSNEEAVIAAGPAPWRDRLGAHRQRLALAGAGVVVAGVVVLIRRRRRGGPSLHN